MKSINLPAIRFHFLFFILLPAIFLHAETVLLDFEDIPSESSGQVHQIQYKNSGFHFRSQSGGFQYRDSSLISPSSITGRFNPPVNGTKYLASFTGSIPTLSRLNGAAFSIISMDIGEYSSVFIDEAVYAIGYLINGDTVSKNFVLDGHVDALIDPPDFQTFQFGSEWSNLVEVKFYAITTRIPSGYIGASFDNIRLVSIPEPAGAPMLLFILMYAVGMRRRTGRNLI